LNVEAAQGLAPHAVQQLLLAGELVVPAVVRPAMVQPVVVEPHLAPLDVHPTAVEAAHPMEGARERSGAALRAGRPAAHCLPAAYIRSGGRSDDRADQ
jgi:hypothetical protein